MFSNVTLLFFVLLIPLAGFIAWAGDYIGHRTGKRRQSLFGLRPRHTALIFTIAAGMAIALASFGLFFVFSESFRVVLRDGEVLYQNNRRLKADNKRQAKELEMAAARVTRLRADTDRLSEERQKAEKARNEALTRLEDADLKRVKAEQRLTQAEAERTDAEDRARQAKVNYERAESGLAQARSELSQARRGLAATQNDLTDTRSDLIKENARVEKAEKDVAAASKRVADARAEQTKAEKDARNARANAAKVEDVAQKTLNFQRDQLAFLRSQLDDQNKQYADLAGKTEKQLKELEALSLELARKRKEYDTLVANATTVRNRQITYQVGEEVDRIAIKGGLNVWRIQYMLDSFLTAAAKKAEARGAARGKEERAIVIPPRMVADAGTSQGGGPQIMDEDDALHAAANAIRRANEDVLIVATVVSNTVAGEPVAVDLRIHRNPVVLKKDARVGQIILNGEKSRQEIADAVYTFLSRDVHNNLMKAGMVPPSRGEEGSEEFSLTGEEWFKIMDDVRRAGSRPRLTVYAAKDLRAGDNAALRFEVRTTIPWGTPPPVDGSGRPAKGNDAPRD
jgi:hypothetical protein